MKPSGSKTDLLLACQWPFSGVEWPGQTTGEAAEIGTVFHWAVAKSINWPNDELGVLPEAVVAMCPLEASHSVKYLDNLRKHASNRRSSAVNDGANAGQVKEVFASMLAGLAGKK